MQIPEPWPAPRLLIPRGSTIKMSCTSLDQAKSPSWSIDIGSDGIMFHYQFGSQDGDAALHNAGLFRIVEPATITTERLLINNTAVNNQTMITCNRHQGAVATTTLFIFSRSLFMYQSTIHVAYSQFAIA